MDAHSRIVGHEQLTSIFARWPSFHDAEVLWYHLDRRATALGAGPTVEAMVHAFETTNDTDSRGYLVLRHHVLVDFRFSGVVRLKCDGFSHQNSLYGLSIKDIRDRQMEGLDFEVSFDSAYGSEGFFFTCSRVQVVALRPCDAAGEALLPQM